MRARKVKGTSFKSYEVILVVESEDEEKFLKFLSADGHYISGVLINRTGLSAYADRYKQIGFNFFDNLKEVLED